MAVKQLNPLTIRFTVAERELLQAEADRRQINRHQMLRQLALAAIQPQPDDGRAP